MITLPEGISAVGVSGPVSTSSRIHVLAKINYSSMLRVLELHNISRWLPDHMRRVSLGKASGKPQTPGGATPVESIKNNSMR